MGSSSRIGEQSNTDTHGEPDMDIDMKIHICIYGCLYGYLFGVDTYVDI